MKNKLINVYMEDRENCNHLNFEKMTISLLFHSNYIFSGHSWSFIQYFNSIQTLVLSECLLFIHFRFER